MRALGFVCVAMLMLAAGSAQAAIYYPQEVSGYDCAGNMSTTNCFSSPTPTGWTNPTTMVCEAKGSRNQRCRNCLPKYGLDGQPLGYNTCAYVADNAACDCKPAGEIRCTGNTWSSCSYSW
jgi:hypothetical protein